MIYKNPINEIGHVEEDEFFIVADEAFQEAGFFDQIDRWKTSNQNHAVQVFKSNSISDKDYDKLKYLVNIMKTTEDYAEYKKAFDRFCYYCHIVSRGVILKKYDLKQGRIADHNSIYVEYSYNTKKIQLPENITLYHMSKTKGIKNLLPFFRGKAVKGFLYDKARIYFTIRRHMPKFLADYKMNDKLHVYKCKEKIQYAYVDPLVWSNLQGAVYVETNKPIPVDEIDNRKEVDEIKEKEKKLDEKESSSSSKNESTEIDFDNFFNFVTENGLILDEE